MATVARRPTNNAFDRSADVPEGFAPGMETSAPTSGEFHLPTHLWWSAQDDRLLDFAVEETRVFVYEKVLRNGAANDVVEWVDPIELLRAWDQMQIGAAVHDVWQPWIDEHWTADLPPSQLQ